MSGMGASLGNTVKSAKEFKVSTEQFKDSMMLSYTLPPSGGVRARFTPRAAGNQRQLRKDRRRAHAAGIKNAFTK